MSLFLLAHLSCVSLQIKKLRQQCTMCLDTKVQLATTLYDMVAIGTKLSCWHCHDTVAVGTKLSCWHCHDTVAVGTTLSCWHCYDTVAVDTTLSFSYCCHVNVIQNGWANAVPMYTQNKTDQHCPHSKFIDQHGTR